MLRNGAAARHHLPAPQVNPHRAHNAHQVYARISVEARVFGRNGRLLQRQRSLFDGKRGVMVAGRVGNFIEQPPIARQNLGGRHREVLREAIKGGQIDDEPAPEHKGGKG